MKRTALLITAVITVLLSGCSTTTIDELRNEEANIESGDAIVVLGRRHNSGYETEPDFIQCIADRIASGSKEVPVIPEFEFMNELYPWFEPRTAPLGLGRMQRLMERPVLSNRLRDLAVRYVVWVDGSTETEDSTGSISCAIGPGGAGCIGFGAWEDDATYEATVWDVQKYTVVAKVSARAEGTSYMPAVVVPVPLLARVQSKACAGLGSQLQDLFFAQ